jgi:hypothetical protein
MFALSFDVFRINFTPILDGFWTLKPVQTSYFDSHNRSKNERTFFLETFGRPVRGKKRSSLFLSVSNHHSRNLLPIVIGLSSVSMNDESCLS